VLTNLMKSVFKLLCILLALFFVFCCTTDKKYPSKDSETKIILLKEHDSLYYIQIQSDSLTDRWELPYPVYQFKMGDVRLSKPLVDFNFVKNQDGSFIRSVEKEKSGQVLIAEYQWRRFGLEFKRYIQREIDSIEALKMLENK